VCNPMLIMAGALEIGSQVSNHLAKNKAAKENKAAALTDMRMQFSDVNAREIEEQKAAANQIASGLKQKQSAQGTALAAAAGAGVGGLSVEALLHSIEGDAAEYTDSVQENLAMVQSQSRRDKLSIFAGTYSRINSVQPPSIIGTGLKIGGDALGLYRQYKNTQDTSRG
jgi:hypothetical protein